VCENLGKGLLKPGLVADGVGERKKKLTKRGGLVAIQGKLIKMVMHGGKLQSELL